MFDHCQNSFRAEKPPTEAELWARREAKSDAMAADLLAHPSPSRPNRTPMRRKRPLRFAAMVVFTCALALILYWL